MDKSKVNLERLRAYDAEWEEDKHPRAENGQFTSGSGGSAGGSSGGGSTSGSSSTSGTKKYNQKDLQKLANNYLNYHLGYNETDATADKVEIVSEPDEHGNVDAKVSYDVSVRIPYQETDSDGYTRTTYEEDSEYRTDIISLNISELKPEEPEAPKSPLRQAAETIQGGGGPKGYKGLSYTQTTSEADSDTPEGELHNMIVGNLGNDEPTKENILKSIKLATKNYEDSLVFCAEKVEAAESVGNEKAAAQWRAKKQEQLDKIRLATKIAKNL